MDIEYLDKAGLNALWAKIKSTFATKSELAELKARLDALDGGGSSGGPVYYIQKTAEIGNIDASGAKLGLFSYISTNGTYKCDDSVVSLSSDRYGNWINIPANTSSQRTLSFTVYLQEDSTKKVQFTFTQAAANSGGASGGTGGDDVTIVGLSKLEDCEVSGNNAITVTGINEDYTLVYLDSDGEPLSNYGNIEKNI